MSATDTPTPPMVAPLAANGNGNGHVHAHGPAGVAASRLELRSDELEEIISHIPGRLVRWGISCVAGTLLVLLAVSWFVRYPERVAGRATFTTPEPPVRMVARTGGEIQRLLVADGQRVRGGDLLAVLNTPADADAVLRLRGWLDALAGRDPVLAAEAAPPPVAGAALGELQPAHAELSRAVAELSAYRRAPYHADRLAALRGQLATQLRLSGSLQARQRLVEQEIALAERERGRSREMAQRGLISPAELERAEQEYLRKRQELESGRNAMLEHEVQVASRRGELLQLEQGRDEELVRRSEGVRIALSSLRAAVASWEQSYLLRAPTGGRVSFFKPLAEHQYVAASEAVMAVVPDAGAAVGKVQVGAEGAGRIRVGQRVILEFEGYPRNEYGIVEARVRSVPLLGYDEERENARRYLVDLSLPRGLATSSHRRLLFRQEMQANAWIITENRRLFARLFDQFREPARRP
ncbi:MAG TPA: HlyD family efflux transporter periplasmic adaptor subunit [Longimicrobium sp.]|nr:HlyD family efflux transporter periplasmic adaptor subunit [Longimicrobium sp.]